MGQVLLPAIQLKVILIRMQISIPLKGELFPHFKIHAIWEYWLCTLEKTVQHDQAMGSCISFKTSLKLY